jgi:hypothetical protein
MNSKAMLATAVACLCVSSVQSASADDLIYEWYTVANNGDVIPTDSSSSCGSCHEDMASSDSQLSAGAKVFNSYNQPAINKDGVVVFRARSRGGHGGSEGGSGHGGGEEGGTGGGGAGGGGTSAAAAAGDAGGGGESGGGGSGSGGMGGGSGSEPERGIYMRNLAEQGPLYMVFRRSGAVPQPNNTTTGKGGELATFNEFPSVPRIDAGSDTIATRGQSTPVWTYLDDKTGTETRTGTAGIYVTSSHGMPAAGASMLGDVYEGGIQTFPYFQVPVHGAVPAGTGFDQFPGSPAVTERTTIVFKGNFSVGGVGKTGVFYRDFAAKRGAASVEVIASSFTKIPGSQTNFGSTAPPSAGGKYTVFAGYDNEQAPTKGGIYRARLGNKPIVLETVVKIGDPVPGELNGETFDRFGEAISVSSNGRHVLFWGGWGDPGPDGEKTRDIPLACPAEGNADMRAYCATVTPEGTTGQVPKYQGFFLRDMQSGTTTVIAKTGDVVDGRTIEDFVYWNFSGRVPGKGHGGEEDIEETLELARWRSTSFGAVSGTGAPGMSVVKARFADNIDGLENEHALLLRDVKPSRVGDLEPLLRTGDLGAMVDPDAPAGAVISALGIERDGFRGNWLAVNVSMLVPSAELTAAAGGEESEEETGWAGIYAAHFLDDEEAVAY